MMSVGVNMCVCGRRKLTGCVAQPVADAAMEVLLLGWGSNISPGRVTVVVVVVVVVLVVCECCVGELRYTMIENVQTRSASASRMVRVWLHDD